MSRDDDTRSLLEVVPHIHEVNEGELLVKRAPNQFKATGADIMRPEQTICLPQGLELTL
jgi:hypothetical protein